MGKERTQTTSEQSASSQAKATPQEQQLLDFYNRVNTETGQQQIDVQKSGLDLIRQLLQGGALPGGFGGTSLYEGISPAVTQNIVDLSLRDVAGQSQLGGYLDSGVRAALSGRISGDIRNQAEQFNIGNRLNLLSLGIGGQAQIQQPLLAQQGQFASSLQGLRQNTATGYSNQNVYAMNPFLKSFQTNLGQTLGAPKFSVGPFSVGGK